MLPDRDISEKHWNRTDISASTITVSHNLITLEWSQLPSLSRTRCVRLLRVAGSWVELGGNISNLSIWKEASSILNMITGYMCTFKWSFNEPTWHTTSNQHWLDVAMWNQCWLSGIYNDTSFYTYFYWVHARMHSINRLTNLAHTVGSRKYVYFISTKYTCTCIKSVNKSTWHTVLNERPINAESTSRRWVGVDPAMIRRWAVRLLGSIIYKQ